MSAGGTKLMYAWKTLRVAWDEATADWKDQVARDFEVNYLRPLEDGVQATSRAMDKLADVLNRARRDCS